MAGAIVPNYFEFGIHKTTVPMSDFAIANDAVLRSDNNIMLQSGTGAAALFIKKSDNLIGIGNSAPTEKLDVTGFTNSSSGYKTGTFGKVIDDLGNFIGLNLTVDTHTLLVNATNRNVGIGTSTPDADYKLEVVGNTRIKGNLTVDGTTTVVNKVVDSSTSEQLIVTNDGTGPAVTITQKGATSILQIFDDDNTCFYIQDGGKILIGGIASSDYHLDVSGNTHFVNNVDVSQNLNVTGSLTCGSMQINGDFGVKGNFDLSENFRIRGDRFTISPEGNVGAAGTVDISNNLTINTNKFKVTADTGNTDLSGNLSIRDKFHVTNEGVTDMSGNLTIATNKFQVLSASGNTDMSGNLTINTDKFKVTAETGNTDLSGNLSIRDKFYVTNEGVTDMSGNLTIATNKFQVLSASGNVGAAGTLDISNNFTVNANKFQVLSESGNTDMSGNLTIATDKFQVLSASGNVAAAGTLDISKNFTVNANKFQVLSESGNTDMSGNLTVATDKFQVLSASGNMDMSGNLSIRDKFHVTNEGVTDMSGNLTVATNKFQVLSASGNVDMSGNLTIATDKFKVTSTTGATDLSGNLSVRDRFVVIGESGNTDIKGTLTLAGNLAIDTNVLFVDVTTNKVGVNTVEPGFDLDVNGSVATNNAIMFNNGTDGLFANRNNNTATDYSLKQTSTGLTTINCKSGAGNIQFTHGDASVKQEFDSLGNVIIQGNLFSYSDARIKTNIETIVNALDKVISIRGVTYNMIKDIEIDPENAQKHIGVIAQEIESVIPEAVKEENGIKTVAYGNIVGLLIEAIKELKNQIQK